MAADCHPQTIAVVKGRAEPMASRSSWRLPDAFAFDDGRSSARSCSTRARTAPSATMPPSATPPRGGRLVAVAADLLSLTLLTPPGSLGPTWPWARRSASACRWATAARTPRTLPRANAFKRKVPGRMIGVSKDMGGDGAPHGAPDARAAHPPRARHLQHLHGAGAPGRHGLDVRRLPRPRGPEGHRHPRARPHEDARRGPPADGPHRPPRRLLRHAARRPGGRTQGAVRRPPRRTREINLRYYDDGSVGVRSTRRRLRRPRRPVRRLRRPNGQARSTPSSSPRAGERLRRPAAATRRLPHAPRLPAYHSERPSRATSTAWRRRTSRSRTA